MESQRRHREESVRRRCIRHLRGPTFLQIRDPPKARRAIRLGVSDLPRRVIKSQSEAVWSYLRREKVDEVVLRRRRIMNYNSVHFLCQLLSGAGSRSKGGALVFTSSQYLMELMAPDQLWPSRGRESGGGGSSSGGGGGGTGCLELGRLRGAVPEKVSSAALTGVTYIVFFCFVFFSSSVAELCGG